MDLSPEVVLFLGAGASLPKPAGSPLFWAIRDACAKRAGSDPRRLYRAMEKMPATEKPPGVLLLDHIIPEVFLKEVADAGYELHEALARAVRGVPGTGPNSVHRLAADLLVAGGKVWTTNWDTWIEQAWGDKANGIERKIAVAPDDEPTAPDVRLFKLHGTATRAQSLRFATPDIMRPLSQEWHNTVVESADGRILLVVGYGGADIDLFPALGTAMHKARAAYWFDGLGDAGLEKSDLAAYERWRYQLKSGHRCERLAGLRRPPGVVWGRFFGQEPL